MKFYYAYILLFSDGLTYTGFTNNISRRFDEHQNGRDKTCFTFDRRPVELIFHQEFNDVHQAIYFEKKIKKWSGKKKTALAKCEYDLLQILAACRNATHSDFKPDSIKVSTALDRTNIKLHTNYVREKSKYS